MVEPNGNIQEGGSQDQSQTDWRESLPEDMRADKSFEKFKDVGGLAGSYLESQSALSKAMKEPKGAIAPAEDAEPEAWDTYFNALGRPETAEGYGLEAPAELPEGMTYNADRTKALSDVAHKLGLNKAQLSGLHGAYNDMAKAEFEANTAANTKFLEESTATIKKEWGADFEANLKAGDTAIDRIFGNEFNKFLQDTGLGNHPAVIRGMFKASQAIGEHALKAGDGGGQPPSTFTMEQLISMKMDPRYSDPGKRDPHYIKQVEVYNQGLADQMEKDRDVTY